MIFGRSGLNVSWQRAMLSERTFNHIKFLLLLSKLFKHGRVVEGLVGGFELGYDGLVASNTR